MEKFENPEAYQNNYDESSFFSKVIKFAKKAGIKLIYLALLLFYTLDSDSLSFKDKITIYGALGYFILPIDLIPDSIPVIGLSDDFSFLIFAYEKVKDNITDEIRIKAKNKLYSIFGQYDELEIKDL